MSLLRSFFVLSTLLTVPSLAADLSRTTIPGKWIEPLLPEDAPALKHPGYFGELDKARAEAFGGRYRKALSMLRQIKDADPVEVALVRGPALAALGRVDEAVATLSDPDVIDEPRVQIGRATVLADAGKTSDALALVKTHLVKHPDSIAGRYCLGALSERTGDLDAARAAYVWFVDEPQRFLDKWQGSREKGFDDAEQVTLIGRAIDRWAILTGQYPNNPALHNTILNLFVRAYDVIDRSYWPAHVAAAEFYIAHDNAQAALMELAQAQEANPRDRRALELVGLLALDLHKFDAAEQTIATLRDVDANSLTADLLEARSLLLQRRTRAADVVLRRVLAAHPDNIDALTLSATLALLRTRDVDAAAIFSRIDRLVPDNATPYHDAADVLTSLWQYHRAEDLYQIATERAPWWNAPRNGLGLLYTQNGEEDQARAVLDAAHAVDPFNLKTTNYLRILDRMAQFKRHETEHFVFLYDPIDDPVVPEYFAPYMEEAYKEVTADFKHEPARKTLVEVFPTIDQFSVRTAGMPGAETFGASFGPVITAVAPRTGETMGRFHWARVLRHEFTHVMNMSQTEHRCPRWLTEGLAVWQEKVPFRFEWVPPALYRAATTDEMFTIDGLREAFVRPRRPTDGEMGYMQGFWVTEYLREKYGPDSIVRLLECFKQGMDDFDAFRATTGKSAAEFEREYHAWAKERVKDWGYDQETAKKYKDVTERAEEHTKARQDDEGLKLWQEANKLQPFSSLPHRRLAGLYLRQKQIREAIPHLEALIPIELKDNRYAVRIARLYRDIDDVPNAQRYAMTAVYIDPYDPVAHELLAELYERAGGREAQAKREREVAALLKERQTAAPKGSPDGE